LGNKQAVHLNLGDVNRFRTKRFCETTKRGGPPAPATVDHEVELLKRMLNFAVDCGDLSHNPISRAKLLRKPNVRRSVVDDEAFARLFDSAEPNLKPIILTAYDTGMRLREVLDLRWSQVDLASGSIYLAAQDTKTQQPRTPVLLSRTKEVLKILPRHIHSEHLFVNPVTGKPWNDIKKMFRRACKKAGLEGLWFHDLRRSFVTNARRRGVPESVIMKMTGHKTRSVFDRYNVVSEDDLHEAVKLIESKAGKIPGQLGHFLDTCGSVAAANEKSPSVNC
jgi:integrase